MKQLVVRAAKLPWMPLGEGVWIRPLRFYGEERSLQLKVAPNVVIERHVHAGAVHAFNIAGSRQLDTGEIVGPGDYVYEPAGNIDWWKCIGDEHCIIQINMSGRLTYLGENDECLNWTDTTKLKNQYLTWCAENGHEPLAIGAAN